MIKAVGSTRNLVVSYAKSPTLHLGIFVGTQYCCHSIFMISIVGTLSSRLLSVSFTVPSNCHGG